MATIKDVAKLAGVSVATVSRVINDSPKASDASRQAVTSAMEELNYHPNANARALAQQTTETIGLIVGDVSDPFFGAMVKAVEQVAYRTGNFLLIGNGYHNEQKERQAIEQLIRHRCAALVVHAKKIPDDELISLMKQMPGMVVINRILPGFEQRCVALDDRYGAWLATRHLIQQGHTKIGYLCSNHQISDAEDRLQGYYDALTEHGLPINDRLVTYGEPDESGGEQAMTELLGRGKNFSAVACYNDSMAAGALGVLNDNGIDVPKEISLIGFDDVLISRYVRPRLTTVRYPIITMAEQAAELALALAEKRELPEITHMFSPTLVRRHSVIAYVGE
ncbi:HTH-type transcriptional regulator GalR [Buttiauxella izardii]|uniref:HTH-type transcriptional regulator GalR n=1 Tax=Buttiauxella izardii TaxID=82991 RepID=A0A3A5JXA1_9ENTR|nr:HTH-type transcriptional regulator GalR [Buttiauxella izardii]RJT27478.1 HTH-type transcriptional regulator GalR [Buttiauxella izardii]